MPNIHPWSINLEVWSVRPNSDICKLNMPVELMHEEGIKGNVELELDISTAEHLVKALQAAFEVSKSSQQGA